MTIHLGVIPPAIVLPLIIGVALGLGGLIGWRMWVNYDATQAEQASFAFWSLLQSVGEQSEEATQKAVRLKESYAASPYAALAALELAKMKSEDGDLEGAATELRWVLDNGSQQVLREISTLRLARVLVAQSDPDAALRLLESGLPLAYRGLVEEIRGDAYRAKGQIDEARAAYDRALQAAGSGVPSEYLQMKRDDLGSNTAPEQES